MQQPMGHDILHGKGERRNSAVVLVVFDGWWLLARVVGSVFRGEHFLQRGLADETLRAGPVVLVAPVTLRLARVRDLAAAHAALVLGDPVLVAPPRVVLAHCFAS